MKKTLLTGLAMGIFMFSLAGLVQAGCDSGEDFSTEGPAFKCESKKMPIKTAKIENVDYETFFTEGARVSIATKGQKTLTSSSLLASNFYSEGRDYQLHGSKAVDALRKQAIGSMPAAGSN